MIELNVWKFEKDGVQFLNRLYIINNDITDIFLLYEMYIFIDIFLKKKYIKYYFVHTTQRN